METQTANQEGMIHMEIKDTAPREDMDDERVRGITDHTSAAMEYIRVNFTKPDLSLEEIAEQLNLAPNYLSWLFSRSQGQRLFDYIKELRVGRSLELLAMTRDSINEVSGKSGFGSTRSYIRTFKKIMDTTPAAWRRQHLSKCGDE